MTPLRTALLCALAVTAAAGPAAAVPGDVSLVSLSSGGAPGAQPAEASAVSADGRHVAFTSLAQLTGTPVAVVQLYVRDRVAGTTVLASSSAAGAAADGAVDVEDVGNVQFAISGNGRYVVFASTATNLTPADTDNAKDVFRKDLQTGAVDLLSVSSGGQKANAAAFGDPDVSYDGRRASFGSGAATNLFPGDGNNASDVVVRDLAAGTTTLAAVSQAGVQANGVTERSAMSADGKAVAFEAPTGTFNLLPGDADGAGNDVVVRNLGAGTTAGASDPTAATGSGFPDISGDGRYAVFETGQKYDATNDVSAGNDVYRRDMTTGAVALVSARDGLDTGGNTDGIRPAISADGTRVAFTSTSTDLDGGDGNAAVRDVYTRDVGTRVTQRSSARSDGAQSINASEKAAISGNGAFVTFVNSDAGTMLTLAPGDANSQPDVFAKELVPTDTTPPVVQLSGTATDPSGIGEVTVNGVPVEVRAGGAFTVPAVPCGSTVTVRATDGAGNTAVAAVASLCPSAPGARPRIQALRAKLVGRKLTVRFRLDRPARVTVTLLRRAVVKKPKRKVVLTRVGRPVARSLQAGRRAVVLTLKRRPAAGRYVIRVRASAAGLATTKTTALVVKPRPKLRR